MNSEIDQNAECAAKASLATPTVRALADMAARALSPVPR
jgi:hypothetical protein